MNKLLIAVGVVFVCLMLYAVFFRIASKDSTNESIQKTVSISDSMQSEKFSQQLRASELVHQNGNDSVLKQIADFKNMQQNIIRLLRNPPKNIAIIQRNLNSLLKGQQSTDSLLLVYIKKTDSLKASVDTLSTKLDKALN